MTRWRGASGHERTQAQNNPFESRNLPGQLSFIAGLTDVTGFLTLGGLFTAHITGNIVVLSADVVRRHAAPLGEALAVPMFVLVTVAAFLMVIRRMPATHLLVILFLSMQFACFVLALTVATTTHSSRDPHGVSALIVGMSAVAAMAFQNAMLHIVRKDAPTTAVMTGNLVAATLAFMTMLLGPKDERTSAQARWRATWPLLVGFLFGCITGAAAVFGLADYAWLLPAIFSAAILIQRAAADSKTT